MPIENYNWTNCRKCGHRYGKHIPSCPRCNARTKLISGKIIAAVSIGVALIGVFYVLSSGTFAVQAVQDSFKNTVTEVSSNLPSAAPREPVETYSYCYSYIRGDFEDDKYDYADTECFNKRFGIISGDGSQKKLASFKFQLPAALDNLVVLRAESIVYQYGENDFELGLFDEVGEKQYQVRLWELPT